MLYARVSTREQAEEGYSIDAQLKAIRQYATQQGFEILKSFVDVETAKRRGRKGFSEMVRFLCAQPSPRPALITEKTDRLYRNLRDYVDLDLDELDLEIHLVKEHEVLSKDSRSQQKFMHVIKVAVAKNYSDNLSEETKKGMVEKAAQGLWPSNAPYGYLNSTDGQGRKVIVPDPEVAAAITRLFQEYVTGRFSLKDLTGLAQDLGLVCRYKGSTLPRSLVHKILRNRVYTGEFDWDGVRYTGTHAPLVSMDLWERVQDVLDERHRKRRRKVKHDFAFARLIECGHCGCSLVGEIQKGKYIYYHCTGARGRCPERYVREEVLADHFAAQLQRLRFDEEVIAWIVQALKESHGDEQRFHDEALTRLQGQYTRLQNRIDAAYEDKLDGLIDRETYERKQQEWRDQQDRIQRQLADLQDANEDYLEDGIQLLELANRCHELFVRQEPREKRRLLDFVLSNSSWKDGELTVEFRQPFAMLAVAKEEVETKTAAGVAPDGRFEVWLPD